MSYILSENFRNIDKASVQGIARIAGVSLNVTKRDTMFASGVLRLADGTEFGFKCWDEGLSKTIYETYSKRQKDFIVNLTGTENLYNGVVSVIISSFSEVNLTEELVSAFNKIPIELLEERKELHKRFIAQLKENVTDKGLGLLKTLLFDDKELFNRFTLEYAAVGKHDATPIGLLRHTTKMLEILDLLFKQHKGFKLNEMGKDLVFIGLVLHDIGKTKEYNEGVLTDKVYVGHRVLGAEWLFVNKGLICDIYDEDFYYELMSIIVQHHGKWEERPRTVYSYLIHLIDMFDTQITMFGETMARSYKLPSMSSNDSDLPFSLKIEPKYVNMVE